MPGKTGRLLGENCQVVEQTNGQMPSEGSSSVREPHLITGLAGEETGEMFPHLLCGEREVGDPGQHDVAGLQLARLLTLSLGQTEDSRDSARPDLPQHLHVLPGAGHFAGSED